MLGWSRVSRCPSWVNRVDFAMSALGPLTLQQQTCCLAIDLLVLGVIQAPKAEHRFMRYELSDCEWGVIKPMLPNKPRGIPRVDDRRVPNGIFWSCGRGRRRGTCRKPMDLVRLATISSSAGGGLASGPVHGGVDRRS
jgi:hypothetical protein